MSAEQAERALQLERLPLGTHEGARTALAGCHQAHYRAAFVQALQVNLGPSPDPPVQALAMATLAHLPQQGRLQALSLAAALCPPHASIHARLPLIVALARVPPQWRYEIDEAMRLVGCAGAPVPQLRGWLAALLATPPGARCRVARGLRALPQLPQDAFTMRAVALRLGAGAAPARASGDAAATHRSNNA